MIVIIVYNVVIILFVSFLSKPMEKKEEMDLWIADAIKVRWWSLSFSFIWFRWSIAGSFYLSYSLMLLFPSYLLILPGLIIILYSLTQRPDRVPFCILARQSNNDNNTKDKNQYLPIGTTSYVNISPPNKALDIGFTWYSKEVTTECFFFSYPGNNLFQSGISIFIY